MCAIAVDGLVGITRNVSAIVSVLFYDTGEKIILMLI